MGAMLVTKYLSDIETGVHKLGMAPSLAKLLVGCLPRSACEQMELLVCLHACMALLLPAFIEVFECAADVRPMAAVAGSNPFDLGAAWRRLSSSVLSLGFFFQYAVALR